MFDSILIANRGEIARRVTRTCRRLGVRAVVVYGDPDRDAPFVREADAAYPLGASDLAHSYLSVERILAAARAAGVQAIHPGYGFLAENAEFAEACAREGLVFIGPPPAAIRAMGLKHTAKALMEAGGVRTLPGYREDAQDLPLLVDAAQKVGYPLLIKAVAGGGGKGLRRVDGPAELTRAIESAQREAQATFGDRRVLIEKYLARSRHIEVQVFADRHGNVVHLFGRDCSVQRRHQKIVEEAPPPGCTPEVEDAIHALAIRATRAIPYEGAGTIELIADVSEGLSPERVYFMEMNTRLQVEHPVTEAITGLDLVEWQLRVAAGEPLPRAQHEITRRGHAVEVRLYAEDPARDYMPQVGRLAHFVLPEGQDLRVDAGVRQGDRLSVHYDSLLAKVIAWGDDRERALRRLARALEQVEVAGVITNLGLLAALARHPALLAGEVHTGFLVQHEGTLAPRDAAHDAVLWALACVGRLEARRRRAQAEPSPWADTGAFRNSGPHVDVLDFVCGEHALRCDVELMRDVTTVRLPTASLTVRDARLEGNALRCELGGTRVRAVYLEDASRAFVFAGGRALEAVFAPSPLALADDEDASSVVRAPMSGTICAVHVAAGDRVARGQLLLSLEAMKMEHTLRAAGAGSVATLHAQVGEQVEEGRVLLTLQTPKAGEDE
ncbi:MAG: biotin carboxylase N-terminal domain-containing protein [Polyangiales bacterium]